jgi:AraC-like DNA-binding protein
MRNGLEDPGSVYLPSFPSGLCSRAEGGKRQMLKIESIAEIHKMIGYEPPKHPLVSLIEPARIAKRDFPEMTKKVVSALYVVSLKNGLECQITYGRKPYDFQEGSMMFLAPNQVITPIRAESSDDARSWNGWVLLFHPDLIGGCALARKMSDYTFFSYDSHEALHVSDEERKMVTDIARAIEREYSRNIDSHSQELIASNIELLLNHSKRFYGRQFITRTTANKDVLVRFEALLTSYFNRDDIALKGLPTVKQCAEQMGYSPNYLSDLLKKETGKNTQEHIHFHLIEKAKTLLLGTEEPVSQIAYALGFEYPQHFSKLFKSKTGISPKDFRS